MSQPFIGEIRMFAGNFAPAGWEFCDGGLLAIAENDPLFALIGTTYGGDGQETFALPDLQGRTPLHVGRNPQSPTTYTLGEKAGVERVTLSTQQIPSHRHRPQAAVAAATATSPEGAVWAASTAPAFVPSTGAQANALAADVVGAAGGSQPHENRHPVLAVSFIISLYGIFPSQN
ncbi:phage tail protein [Cellulomonas biazotea]|uniref:Tail Collar domain-containing protein n=1 Tax=Cellulomonas biazotea TaxID=1709 RepID=A0A402DTJ5_9CELL|nr:tail fiber protein [Cellulomonas biazotea]GCE77453.1 tail Collar domain-containing protein [Cellulomonas biazotea]